MTDAADLIKSVRPSEAAVPICLRGDLLAERLVLEKELAVASAEQANSFVGGSGARQIAERLELLLAEIEENTHLFKFRALPRPEFRQLQEDHPPRDGNDLDRAVGGNLDTLQVPLIAACCTDPVMDIGQARELLDVLSEGQVMELFGCALSLNRSTVDLPKFETASGLLARHAPRSKPPDLGVFPGSDS